MLWRIAVVVGMLAVRWRPCTADRLPICDASGLPPRAKRCEAIVGSSLEVLARSNAIPPTFCQQCAELVEYVRGDSFKDELCIYGGMSSDILEVMIDDACTARPTRAPPTVTPSLPPTAIPTSTVPKMTTTSKPVVSSSSSSSSSSGSSTRATSLAPLTGPTDTSASDSSNFSAPSHRDGSGPAAFNSDNNHVTSSDRATTGSRSSVEHDGSLAQSDTKRFNPTLLVPVAVGSVGLCFAVYWFVVRRKQQSLSKEMDDYVLATDGTTSSPAHTDETSLVMPASTNNTTWSDRMILAIRVPLSSIQFVCLLSRGGYAEVFMGMYQNRPVAIKRLLPDKQRDMDQIDAFGAEIKLMCSLDHERIVKCIGVAWDV